MSYKFVKFFSNNNNSSNNQREERKILLGLFLKNAKVRPNYFLSNAKKSVFELLTRRIEFFPPRCPPRRPTPRLSSVEMEKICASFFVIAFFIFVSNKNRKNNCFFYLNDCLQHAGVGSRGLDRGVVDRHPTLVRISGGDEEDLRTLLVAVRDLGSGWRWRSLRLTCNI